MKFKKLAELLKEIEPLTERTKIRNILKDFLRENSNNIETIIKLITGKIFLPYEGIELNIGVNLIEEAISKAYGYTRDEIKIKHKELGDLGVVAEYFSKLKKQTFLFHTELSIDEVYNTLKSIALEEGTKSIEYKIQKIIYLLNNSSPLEAKYIIKIILQNLRINLGEQTLIEAIALINLEKENINYKENMDLFNKYKKIIEYKYAITQDLAKILAIAAENIKNLDNVKIKIGIPIKSALAEREKNAEAIIKRLGYCIVEAKYDGFRLQIHHNKSITKIFSRRSENITHMFPEIVEALKEINFDFIIDSEVLAYNYKEQKYFNFQETIKRKRKYNITQYIDEYPIIVHIFDVLYFNKETINLPLKERRVLVEKIVNKLNNKLFKATEAIYTDSAKELMNFFNHCINEGLEGIIAKDLNKPYIPGQRDFAWIKLKKNYLKGQFDSVDLVILGYFYGKGKYAHKPSSLLCGIYNNNKFIPIAKVASGLTEELINNLENILTKTNEKYFTTEQEPDVYVIPTKVIEVIYDEITKTNGKYSLRFPRFIRFREDKNPTETTTLKEIEEIYNLQH